MKERIRRENRLLIYKNIDKYKPITRETITVSWTVLNERIKYVLGGDFEKIDSGRLDLAQKLRNQILHYDVALEFPAIYHDFANLFNFVREFHKNEIRNTEKETLYDHIDKEHWHDQEVLFDVFHEEIVYFNEIFMPKGLQVEISGEQENSTIIINGEKFSRVHYGSPEEHPEVNFEYANKPCGDCLVIRGQIHLLDCDMEQCPNCSNQMITCACEIDTPWETA